MENQQHILTIHNMVGGSLLTTSVAPCCYYGVYIGGLGVNGNLLNYPETVTPYHYNWAPLGGGRVRAASPLKRGLVSQGGKVGNQKHSTSCLFLQLFVESEREFLNSLFLTNR